jgi:hypothetical protein
MKWFFPTLLIVLIATLLGASHMSLASEKTKIKGVTCTYNGKFKHTSPSPHEARRATTNACFESEISLRPNLPDDEQADLIIESCLNNTVCS